MTYGKGNPNIWKITNNLGRIFYYIHILKNNYLMLHIYIHINIIQYLYISVHYYDCFNQYDYIKDIFRIEKLADTVLTRILSFFRQMCFSFSWDHAITRVLICSTIKWIAALWKLHSAFVGHWWFLLHHKEKQLLDSHTLQAALHWMMMIFRFPNSAPPCKIRFSFSFSRSELMFTMQAMSNE